MGIKKVGFRDALFVLVLCIGTYLLSALYDVQLISGISLIYAIYLLYILVESLGKRIPLFELTMAMLGVQLIISPILEYYILGGLFLSTMKVDESHYFGYMLPAILAIHFGIRFGFRRYGKLQDVEGILYSKILENRSSYIRQGYILIVIGLLCDILSYLPIPGAIAYIVFLFRMFKEIGVFYLWLAQSRYFAPIFLLVFGIVFITAIRSTIFIDLLVWTVIITSYYLKNVRVNKGFLVVLGLVGFFFLFTLQSVKYAYREIAWDKNSTEETGTSVLLQMMYDQVKDMDAEKFRLAGVAVNVRFNQGWLVSDVMQNIDRNGVSKEKWFFKEFLGVIFPRFLFPAKPKVGNHDKFEDFTGWRLADAISMNVGVVGDGYGNFGRNWGVFFCFMYGLFLGRSLDWIYKVSMTKYTGLFLWIPLIFFYVMRAGNDFYIIANWIVKSSVLVLLVVMLLEKSPLRRSFIKLVKS